MDRGVLTVDNNRPAFGCLGATLKGLDRRCFAAFAKPKKTAILARFVKVNHAFEQLCPAEEKILVLQRGLIPE
jgi:hypothetical protein